MAIVLTQDGLIIEESTTGSGTGNYESFLRLAANGDEEGYNTDANGQLDNKDGIWTHSLLISNLVIVDGFAEIRLDLNEIQSGDKPFITLEELKLYVGPEAGAGAFPSFAGLTLKFDLDDPLQLEDTNHGSGTDDYVIRIPASMLTGEYLTLYAAFSDSDDGFEEFRALSSEFIPTPDIGIVKETEGTDDACPELLVGSEVTWTYTVENNGNIPLTNVVVKDDNGTPGDTGDDFTATYVSGDVSNIGVLDTDETWIFSYTGTVGAGEYDNIATVTADFSHDDGEGGTVTGEVSGFEEDCYYGVTPAIQIVKYTNDEDNLCSTYLVGEDIVWTYEVTNISDTTDGDIYIDAITITDDAGTPGDNPPESDDDFNPTAVLDSGFNVGDTDQDNRLDVGETWLYTHTLLGGAVAGEYENTATVNGTAHDAFSNTAPVEDEESDCYFGADPSIDIIKKTNGTNDLCPVVSVGSTVTWSYFVENTGNVALENIVIRDDNGTADPDTGDDITPTAVLDGLYNVGDLNDDGVFDPGEIWQYSATGVAAEGEYENVAYVSADFTDDFENSTTVYASEEDCYVGVEGPGVRTPGFWQNPNNGGQFWDGEALNEKNAGQDCFPLGELTYQVDSTGDDIKDSVKGLLIGDWDGNGIEDGDEDAIFISLKAANLLINASQKEQHDGRWVVGRDLVASWLNYLAGNDIGEIDEFDGDYTPKEVMQDAIDFLKTFGDTDDDGIFPTANCKTIDWEGSAVKQGTPNWNNIGSPIHGFLDEYNNHGTVDGLLYAHDCDEQQFLTLLAGYHHPDTLLAI